MLDLGSATVVTPPVERAAPVPAPPPAAAMQTMRTRQAPAPAPAPAVDAGYAGTPATGADASAGETPRSAPLRSRTLGETASATPAPSAEIPSRRYIDPEAERAERIARDGVDPFVHRAPFAPTRNPARRRTAIAVVAGVAMLAAVGGIIYSGTPGIAQQFGIPIGTTETPLTLSIGAPERRLLSSGNELFAVSGRVMNATGTSQRIPDIRAVLKDSQGRMVYSWTIKPGVRTLGPSGSMPFNSAKLDVPANAKKLELSFAAGL